jgi:hypothetical protein
MCLIRGRGEVHTGFWFVNLREGDQVEDLGVGGRRDFKEADWEGVDWIDLAHGRDRWWSFVNSVIEPSAPVKFREFLEWLKNI